MEEWNSVPKEMIQNLCMSWINRIKKVHELKGERIEPEYLKKKNININGKNQMNFLVKELYIMIKILN